MTARYCLKLLYLVHRDLTETELFIEFAGANVDRSHLKGNTVSSFFLGPLLALFEEGAADAQASMSRDNVDIFDGGPGFGLEGRRSFAQFSREEADHLPVRLRDEEARVRVHGEVGKGTAHDFLGIGGGNINEVVESMFFGTTHPEAGDLRGVVSSPGADREADLLWAHA
jgi:hypothetical protein